MKSTVGPGHMLLVVGCGSVRVPLQELRAYVGLKRRGGAKKLFLDVYAGIESGTTPSGGLVRMACLARKPSDCPVDRMRRHT